MGMLPTNSHDRESVVVDNPGNYSINQCQLRDCNIDNEKSRWPFYNLLPPLDMNCAYACVWMINKVAVGYSDHSDLFKYSVCYFRHCCPLQVYTDIYISINCFV